MGGSGAQPDPQLVSQLQEAIMDSQKVRNL